jgi:type IV secretory pathway VirB2 component (pilin)
MSDGIQRRAAAVVIGYGLMAQAALAAGDNPILDAVSWVRDILLGPVATTVAVIAVAMVGFMMLTGRMNWKHGAVVILGLFILFGAPRIVASIEAAAGR